LRITAFQFTLLLCNARRPPNLSIPRLKNVNARGQALNRQLFGFSGMLYYGFSRKIE
jgi:hypothetical protein